MKYYAECLVKCGDNETAVKYYTTLIDKCPKAERADYYFLRGCVYIKLKDENKAALNYEKCTCKKVTDDRWAALDKLK